MKETAGGIQLVVVRQADGVGDEPTKQLWVAAVQRDQAVEAVQRVLPEGWSAELSNERLTPEQAARLSLRPGDVRELTS